MRKKIPFPHQLADLGVAFSISSSPSFVAEREVLQATEIGFHDMREIDETGVARPLAAFLTRVAAAGGYRDGTTHVIFAPLDFISKLAALVPKPRPSVSM